MTNTSTNRKIAGAAAAAAVLVSAYLLGSAHSRSQAAASLSTLPAAAATSTAGSGITVSGVGTMAGTPDTLRLDMGIQVTGDTVTAALGSANTKAAAVQKSLRDSGVTDKDLQTTGLSIQPHYVSDGKNGSKVSGYEVGENVSAVLRDLKTAGAAISAAATAGGQATRINGVSLDLADTGALVTGARSDAYAKARAKAEQYAKAAGVSLGQVLSINESVQAPQPIYAAAGAMDSRAAAAVPIQAGSQDVSVTVTVVFAIA
jgi:uncharacterized protein